MAHDKIHRSDPKCRKTLEVKFLGEFESIFEAALDHKSEISWVTLNQLFQLAITEFFDGNYYVVVLATFSVLHQLYVAEKS
jgi:hypothetical protein